MNVMFALFQITITTKVKASMNKYTKATTKIEIKSILKIIKINEYILCAIVLWKWKERTTEWERELERNKEVKLM